VKRYLDANVFILAALSNEGRGRAAARILRETINGTPAVTSTITIDEVLWTIWKQTGERKTALQQAGRLFHLTNLSIAPLTSELSRLSLQLLELNPSLKPRDAIHYATALSLGIKTIVSDDSDFDKTTLKRQVLL